MASELGVSLRAWRDRATPPEPRAGQAGVRRTPGLRREELAVAAGISVNYLTRLEQGRARSPSPSVTGALCRALGLDPAESALLHRMAGHAEPVSRPRRTITPSVRRILDRFDDVPVMVIDPGWTIVDANALAQAMLTSTLVGENSARRQFLGPRFLERSAADNDSFEREIVGDLHLQVARHPADPDLIALVAELRERSARFRALWAEAPQARTAPSRKTINHPVVGRFTVDCDHLDVIGSDLRVVIWTAVSGSHDASALKLLAVVGHEQFAGPLA